MTRWENLVAGAELGSGSLALLRGCLQGREGPVPAAKRDADGGAECGGGPVTAPHAPRPNPALRLCSRRGSAQVGSSRHSPCTVLGSYCGSPTAPDPHETVAMPGCSPRHGEERTGCVLVRGTVLLGWFPSLAITKAKSVTGCSKNRKSSLGRLFSGRVLPADPLSRQRRRR